MQRVHQESLHKMSELPFIAGTMLRSGAVKWKAEENLLSRVPKDRGVKTNIWHERKQLVERMTGKSFFEMLYAPLLRQQQELVERSRRYAQNGTVVKVLVVSLAGSPSIAAKSEYAQDFMRSGGCSVEALACERAEDVSIVVEKHKADAVVLCSDWKKNWKEVLDVSQMLKEKQKDLSLFMAEMPIDLMMDSCQNAGIQDFIYEGANCYRILRELQKKKGMD